MNLAGRKERIENKTIYPIIQNQKSIRNKILDNNGYNAMKSLKNKTIFIILIIIIKRIQKIIKVIQNH